MTDRYVVSIDQGTTSTRCILFDHRGQLVSVVQLEHQQYFPKPGWVEHDAMEIWRNVLRLAPGVCQQARIAPDQIVGLGIANQRETTVLWDRHTGIPVGHALVWQDTRTDELVAQALRRAGRRGDRAALRPPAGDLLLRAAHPLDARPHRRACANAPNAATSCSARWRPG